MRDKFEKLLNEITQVTTLPAIFEFGNIFAPLYLAINFENMLNPQGLFISMSSNTSVMSILLFCWSEFQFCGHIVSRGEKDVTLRVLNM